MKVAVLLALVAAWVAFAPDAARADPVAIVAGAAIDGADIAPAGTVAARAARLRDRVLEKVLRHYVAERNLAATPGEVAELRDYHQEFDRRDRAQRTRKLEELNARLAQDALPDAERGRLEEFRAVLLRLAAQDAASDREPPGDTSAAAAAYVEWWKVNKALHEQYGGAVGLTRDGPVAQGAYAALVADYERRGLVRFLDPELRAALMTVLAEPPGTPVPPAGVDFTPYWKRPIPPSYFPD